MTRDTLFVLLVQTRVLLGVVHAPASLGRPRPARSDLEIVERAAQLSEWDLPDGSFAEAADEFVSFASGWTSAPEWYEDWRRTKAGERHPW